jgi:TIR domain
MSASSAHAIEVFISYSHKDEKLRKKLGTHLTLLQRRGIIDQWHDRRIGAGQEWAGAIDEHLNSAAIILLLVSPDFLASDYCYDLEMKRALERHDAGDVHVIPVILRPVDLEGAPFAKLQALPRDAKPVRSWANEDEAFNDVARGIRKVAEEL